MEGISIYIGRLGMTFLQSDTLYLSANIVEWFDSWVLYNRMISVAKH